MPRAIYDLKFELLQPVDWPGSPDVTGVADLRIPMETIRNGRGQVVIGGSVRSPLMAGEERFEDQTVTIDGTLEVVVSVQNSRATGRVRIVFSPSMDTAAVHIELLALAGALANQTVVLDGHAQVRPDSIDQLWDQIPTDQQLHPVTVQRWPWFFLPMTCGFYPDRDQVPDTLAAISRLAEKHGCRGRIGVNVEGTGDLGNPGANVDSAGILSLTEARFAYLADTLVPTAAGLCVPVNGTSSNSNDWGKGFKGHWQMTAANQAAFAKLHAQLAQRLRSHSEWLLWQAIAETDTSMPADFRHACQRAYPDASFPLARMAAEKAEGGAALNEIHISGVRHAASTGPRDFVTTDNPGGILGHFSDGDVWHASRPRVDEIVASATAHLRLGTSFSAYHRATRLTILENLTAYDIIIGRLASLLKASDVSTSPIVHATADAVPVESLLAPGNEADALRWPIVTTIESVSRHGPASAQFSFSPRPDWLPVKDDPKHVNANWWYFLPHGDGSGRWRGSTFEWTVTGDRARDVRDIAAMASWAPGTEVLFLLTAICRQGKRTASRGRSQVFRWVVPG